MPFLTHTTTDILITRKPCILYSITFSNLGSNEARLNVYNGRSANASDLAVICTRKGYGTWQFRWEGLELDNGLYIDHVERCDSITIEWGLACKLPIGI